MRFLSCAFIVLLFFGALFWAREQDPFVRRWFTLSANGHSFKCVAVLPKPVRSCPIVIYAHGSGDGLMMDGHDLRQMAELGLAVVSLEYEQSNNIAFDAQFGSLLDYLKRQKWVSTNEIAWVGSSLGANRMWDFALRYPKQQPRLLVQLSGRGLTETKTNIPLSTINHQPLTLLIHGDQDEIFPVKDTMRLASVLQTKGLAVDLKVLPGLPHNMEPDREVVFRAIGEYCLTHLAGQNTSRQTSVWQSYHSIAEWQAEAPRFWIFCLPAIIWLAGWLAWWQCRKPRPTEKIKLTRSEMALRWLAIILAIWASAETGIHLLTPRFTVSDKTLAIARKYLVQPKERMDFEFLANQFIWQGQKLQTVLTHVELANYNRTLINWQVDDKIYQDYVLSPIIQPSTINPQPSTDFDWRRPLWEEFYPRIRHETSPVEAATIVVRHLRERVTIANISNPPREVPDIWLRQITDETGFEIIYVAALRSVGVPARLNSGGHAEIFGESQWQSAPQPIVYSFCDSSKYNEE